MSWQATAWVIENSSHKGSALLVMLMIANCANENGSDCWPSLPRLAKDTRLSKRQVLRVIEVLEKSGEITVQHSTGRHSNHYSFPLMNSDKMSPFKTSPNGDISGTNGDISRTNGDIAMSPDPSVERSVDPSLSARAGNGGFKKERSLTLAARSRPPTNQPRKEKPNKIEVPATPDPEAVKALTAWGRERDFSFQEMNAMWEAFRLKHLDEHTPPQTKEEWIIKFQRYVSNCYLSETLQKKRRETA